MPSIRTDVGNTNYPFPYSQSLPGIRPKPVPVKSNIR